MEHSQSDKEQRFRALFEAHYRPVLAFALRRAASQADALEVVSETFLVAWRRFDDVPTGADALPWLYAVARRVLANSERSRRRRRQLDERLAGLAAERVDFEEDIGREEERRVVVAALRRLKPEDRELLRLIAWEGLSHRQVAQVLGCSENAVAIRLHRARERLAVHVAKETRRSGHKPPRGDQPPIDPGGVDHH